MKQLRKSKLSVEKSQRIILEGNPMQMIKQSAQLARTNIQAKESLLVLHRLSLIHQRKRIIFQGVAIVDMEGLCIKIN